MAHEKGRDIELPQSVIGLVDVGRLRRELSVVEDFMVQTSVREPGKQPGMPKTSRSLEELARLNKLNLLVEEDRAQLEDFLKRLRNNAPIIHMSFSSDPSPAFLAKITAWLRSEIHPGVLLQVGLQPGIAAGCILRTPNKYFDFSLRKNFAQKRQLLLEKINGGEG